MAKSRESSENRKGIRGKKPYRGFLLFVHETSRCYRKVRQKHVNFGELSDGQAANELRKQQTEDLLAGRKLGEADDRLALEAVVSD